MNKELDELLCLLDGKITVYRMNCDSGSGLIEIQLKIQKLWNENREA